MAYLPIELPVDDPLVPFPVRLEVIRELIDALGVVTRSGQGHVMHRVLSLLGREIHRAFPRLSPGQFEAVMIALPKLEHEAARIAPSTGAFNGHALVVVDVLRDMGRECRDPTVRDFED